MNASLQVAVGSVWSALVIWLSGAMLARAGRETCEPLLATLASDSVLGLTVVAALGTGQLIAGLPLSRWPVYAVLVVAMLLVVRRRPSLAPVMPPPDRRATLLLLIAVAAVVWLLSVARHDALWWDGWAIWAFKAKVLFLEGTLPPDLIAVPGPYDYSHPRYPVGVPLVTAWFYAHVGVPSGAVASLVGALWFAVLVGYVWEILRRRVPLAFAALATAAIAWLDPVASYAVGGTAEIAMSLALLGVVDALTGPATDTRAAWRAGTALLLGVLAKQEGLALAVVTSGVLALTWRHAARDVPWRWAVAGLAPIAAWLLWQTLMVQGSGARMLPVQPLSWDLFSTRAIDVLTWSGTLLLGAWWWPILALVVAGLLSTARSRRRSLEAGWLAVGGYVAALIAVYLTTSYDHLWLLRTSYLRVMSATLPALVTLAVWALSAPATDAPPASAPSPAPAAP